MGTLRNLKGQGRFQRHEPKLSEETLKDLRTYALHSVENNIFDYATRLGEVNIWLRIEHVGVDDMMSLAVASEITTEAIQNLVSAEAIEILEPGEYSVRIRPMRSSNLSDVQLKILDALENHGLSMPMAPARIKQGVNRHGFDYRVKEIRTALSEMEEKGLVTEKAGEWRKV